MHDHLHASERWLCVLAHHHDEQYVVEFAAEVVAAVPVVEEQVGAAAIAVEGDAFVGMGQFWKSKLWQNAAGVAESVG